METTRIIYKLLESLETSSNIDVITAIKQAIPVIFEGYTNYDTGLHTPRGFQIPSTSINYQHTLNNEYFKQTLPNKYLKRQHKQANKYKEVILPVPFTQPNGIQFNS